MQPQILETSLTSRNKNAENPIPMAGVPTTRPSSILMFSLNRGIRSRLQNKMEDPKEAKRVVKREVVQVITPGTVVDRPSQIVRITSWLLWIGQEMSMG